MLTRRARRALFAAALLVAPLLAAQESSADHDRPGGTWTPAVSGPVPVQYRHYNPWVCSNPPVQRYVFDVAIYGDCEWDGANPESAPSGGIVTTSCKIAAGAQLDCGHRPHWNGQWSFAGSNHPGHYSVVIREGYVCPAEGGFAGGEYDIDGHPVDHDGPLCGAWTPTTPTVNISGATVVEGQRAVLSVVAVSSFDGGSGSVSFETVASSASAGADFRAVSGGHSFSDQGLSRQMIVQTVDDDEVETSESFAVRLFGASGVVIGTGSATVTITDNDSPDLPDPDPDPVQTGCDAAGTRLSWLSVTSSGSELLSGFSSGTFSYAVSAESASVLVRATAARSSASLRIGAGGSGTGFASHTVFTSQGSSVAADVVVSFSGDSCVYSLSVSRPAPPAAECPAASGQVLVGGVCMEACPGQNLIPQFDSEGQVLGCLDVGDCPFDLYGLPTPPPNPYRDYNALWTSGGGDFAPVAVSEPASVTRTAVKCAQVWRTDPLSFPNIPHACLWNETNLKASGDCLKFALQVEAVIPAVEADPLARAWHFEVSGCGHNRSADRAATWTPDDAACSSASGQWGRSSFYVSTPTAPEVDPGTWAVTLGDLSAPNIASPYVDVPLEVTVADWGDASHLVITAHVIKREHRWFFYDVNDWGFHTVWPSSGPTIRVEVPRRSGPPPSDDEIELSIAHVSELPFSSGCYFWFGCSTNNGRFVEVLRSHLLANDACPIGTDCDDPLLWPVSIDSDAAQRCNTSVFAAPARSRMQPTSQGMVGCDTLNDRTDASVRYWPRMWAAGRDTFTYRTYGGTATVTARFTDTPPDATDLVVEDAGEHYAAGYYRYAGRVSCRWNRPCGGGHTSGWWLTYDRRDDSAFTTPNGYHTGTVEIAVADADGDFSSLRIINASETDGVELRGGIMTGSGHANLYPVSGIAAARDPAHAFDASADTWRRLSIRNRKPSHSPSSRNRKQCQSPRLVGAASNAAAGRCAGACGMSGPLRCGGAWRPCSARCATTSPRPARPGSPGSPTTSAWATWWSRACGPAAAIRWCSARTPTM